MWCIETSHGAGVARSQGLRRATRASPRPPGVHWDVSICFNMFQYVFIEIQCLKLKESLKTYEYCRLSLLTDYG